MRTRWLPVLGLLLLSVLVAVTGCAGQTPAKPATEAPQAAPVAPTAPSPAPAPPLDLLDDPAPSLDPDLLGLPWLDRVHWLGIAGGALALLAFCGGAVIAQMYARRKRPFSDPGRKRLRGMHMVGGIVAVGLSLAHHFGRWAQEGGPNFGIEPPHLAGVGFLLLGVSGVLRVTPPQAWRKRQRLFMALHRGGFVLALAMMVLHAFFEWRRAGV